jgi:uncharacterized protein (TIGR02147 family)
LAKAQFSPPDIFAFQDFRLYLKAYYQARKAVNRAFSHRFIMKKVGASSQGWFSDLLSGRIKLAESHTPRLLALLQLKPNEEDYFETLVRLDRVTTDEERQKLKRKLGQLKGVRADLIQEEKFSFYGRWYYPALRELLLIHSFRGDFSALGGKMRPKLSALAAKRSIQLLLALGLVARHTDGRYFPTNRILKKDSTVPSGQIRRYLRENMRLASTALERVDREQRDISCITLSFSESGFAKAKEEIRSLRKRLLVLSEEEVTPHRVYQCNLQFFPVSE